MDHSSGNVIDVTERLAEALPDFLADWTRARFYLVCGHGPWSAASSSMRPWSAASSSMRPLPAASPAMPTLQTRGGLAAGTLRRIREYIERELANPISLHDLASVAGLSDCHFARAFKQSVGMPPHRYLMQRRVEKAAMLIQATQRPLSEIALEVGCCDQSHFSRLIVQATGQTPRALRRESFEPTDKRALPGVVA